jgi:hypothetical protein
VGYERSDLVDISLGPNRIRKSRASLGDQIENTQFPRSILACDVLACRASVELTPDEIFGLNAGDFDLIGDFLEFLNSSPAAFREFMEGNWDHVRIAAFVFQIQPLRPELPPFLIFSFSHFRTARHRRKGKQGRNRQSY